MGQVIIVIRVLPDSPDNVDSVRAALQKLKPERLEDEPIGFGLSAFKFTKIIPDEGGSQEKLENQVSAIRGVGNSEVLMASRAM